MPWRGGSVWDCCGVPREVGIVGGGRYEGCGPAGCGGRQCGRPPFASSPLTPSSGKPQAGQKRASFETCRWPQLGQNIFGSCELGKVQRVCSSGSRSRRRVVPSVTLGLYASSAVSGRGGA